MQTQPEVRYDPHCIYYSTFTVAQLQEEMRWVKRMMGHTDDQSYKLMSIDRLQAIAKLLSEQGQEI